MLSKHALLSLSLALHFYLFLSASLSLSLYLRFDSSSSSSPSFVTLYTYIRVHTHTHVHATFRYDVYVYLCVIYVYVHKKTYIYIHTYVILLEESRVEDKGWGCRLGSSLKLTTDVWLRWWWWWSWRRFSLGFMQREKIQKLTNFCWIRSKIQRIDFMPMECKNPRPRSLLFYYIFDRVLFFFHCPNHLLRI